MKDQIAALPAKVEELQCSQSGEPSHTVREEDEDDDKGPGNLVTLTESTQVFLEASFSATLANADHKKRVECIGVPDCDSIRCPKLDSAIQAIVLNDTIKADS